MRPTQLLKLVTALVVVGCVRPTTPSPVACPQDDALVPARTPPPVDTTSSPRRIRIDGPPPSPVFFGPLTLVVDDHVVATMRTEHDTLSWSKAWQTVSPSTIRRVDVLGAPEAAQRYPTAVGGVISITRCYPSDIATHRPNGR